MRESASGKVVYERRNANGINLENQNMHEKDCFCKGEKLVARQRLDSLVATLLVV